MNQIKEELNMPDLYLTNRIEEIKQTKKMTDKDLNEIIEKGIENTKKNHKEIYKQVQKVMIEMNGNKVELKILQKYFCDIKMLLKIGIPLPQEEINIISEIVLYNENFKGEENFKLVVMQYIGLGKYEKAKRFMNMYITNCENSEERQKFRHARNEISKVINKKCAIKLLINGNSIRVVMLETGLNEIEILELQNRYTKLGKTSPDDIGWPVI